MVNNGIPCTTQSAPTVFRSFHRSWSPLWRQKPDWSDGPVNWHAACWVRFVVIPQTVCPLVCPHWGVLTVGVKARSIEVVSEASASFPVNFRHKMPLMTCPCAFRLCRLAQNACPGISVRHFPCKFPHKMPLVKCPCAFRLRRLAQSVLPGLGIGLPPQHHPPQLHHLPPPQHPHHHLPLTISIIIIITIIIIIINITTTIINQVIVIINIIIITNIIIIIINNNIIKDINIISNIIAHYLFTPLFGVSCRHNVFFNVCVFFFYVGLKPENWREHLKIQWFIFIYVHLHPFPAYTWAL